MELGHNIFTAGLADPDLWSNHVWATDIGFNWYLNFYTKIMVDWQHAGFGNVVAMGPDKFSSTTDLFWLQVPALLLSRGRDGGNGGLGESMRSILQMLTTEHTPETCCSHKSPWGGSRCGRGKSNWRGRRPCPRSSLIQSRSARRQPPN